MSQSLNFQFLFHFYSINIFTKEIVRMKSCLNIEKLSSDTELQDLQLFFSSFRTSNVIISSTSYLLTVTQILQNFNSSLTRLFISVLIIMRCFAIRTRFSTLTSYKSNVKFSGPDEY